MDSILSFLINEVGLNKDPLKLFYLVLYLIGFLFSYGFMGYIRKYIVLIWLPWFDSEKGGNATTFSLIEIAIALVGFAFLFKTEQHREVLFENYHIAAIWILTGLGIGFIFHQLMENLFKSSKMNISLILVYDSIRIGVLLLPVTHLTLTA